MKIEIEFEQEEDGRWIAEVPTWPGVMAYGENKIDAARRVQALALRVLADKLENGAIISDLNPVSFIGTINEPMAVC